MSLESLMIKEKQESVLHPKEKEYFEALRFDRRKASYLMGRYCAKKALSYQLQGQKLNTILIKSGVFEQPIVYAPENKGVQVSIAHSGDPGQSGEDFLIYYSCVKNCERTLKDS